jgi:hypothetical protein
MTDGKRGTCRIVTMAHCHHRGAEPDYLCAIQVSLQDEQERVLDFQTPRLARNGILAREKFYESKQ